MRRLISRRKAMDIASKALASGAALQVPVITWDAQGSCEEPVCIEFEGRPGVAKNAKRIPPALASMDGHAIFIDMKVACRTKCEPCLRKRGFRWAISINRELARARRSWMVTLTCEPDYLVRCKLEVADALTGDIDYRTEDEQFRRLCGRIGKDLTLYLKRLRKRLAAKRGEGDNPEAALFRYCAVFEKHKSGEPHIHLVVHESIGGVPIRWADLVRDQTKPGQRPEDVPKRWPHGHAEGHIVGELGKGWYLAKYLSKEACARVRASQGYFVKVENSI